MFACLKVSSNILCLYSSNSAFPGTLSTDLKQSNLTPLDEQSDLAPPPPPPITHTSSQNSPPPLPTHTHTHTRTPPYRTTGSQLPCEESIPVSASTDLENLVKSLLLPKSWVVYSPETKTSIHLCTLLHYSLLQVAVLAPLALLLVLEDRCVHFVIAHFNYFVLWSSASLAPTQHIYMYT